MIRALGPWISRQDAGDTDDSTELVRFAVAVSVGITVCVGLTGIVVSVRTEIPAEIAGLVIPTTYPIPKKAKAIVIRAKNFTRRLNIETPP